MHESEKWKWSRSVVSDPQRPHGPQPSRLLRPWDFPSKSTGVGCHCLLRLPFLSNIKVPTSEDNNSSTPCGYCLLSIHQIAGKIMDFVMNQPRKLSKPLLIGCLTCVSCSVSLFLWGPHSGRSQGCSLLTVNGQYHPNWSLTVLYLLLNDFSQYQLH